ncbi:MAG: hypothetical protein NW200_04370 [Hyphomonadaceae bacterium]|nr:hypothetical protein [Hyphomonadaceae bacterium]
MSLSDPEARLIRVAAAPALVWVFVVAMAGILAVTSAVYTLALWTALDQHPVAVRQFFLWFTIATAATVAAAWRTRLIEIDFDRREVRERVRTLLFFMTTRRHKFSDFTHAEGVVTHDKENDNTHYALHLFFRLGGRLHLAHGGDRGQDRVAERFNAALAAMSQT